MQGETELLAYINQKHIQLPADKRGILGRKLIGFSL
jgi:hypothetical protein